MKTHINKISNDNEIIGPLTCQQKSTLSVYRFSFTLTLKNADVIKN